MMGAVPPEPPPPPPIEFKGASRKQLVGMACWLGAPPVGHTDTEQQLQQRILLQVQQQPEKVQQLQKGQTGRGTEKPVDSTLLRVSERSDKSFTRVKFFWDDAKWVAGPPRVRPSHAAQVQVATQAAAAQDEATAARAQEQSARAAIPGAVLMGQQLQVKRQKKRRVKNAKRLSRERRSSSFFFAATLSRMAKLPLAAMASERSRRTEATAPCRGC